MGFDKAQATEQKSMNFYRHCHFGETIETALAEIKKE